MSHCSGMDLNPLPSSLMLVFVTLQLIMLVTTLPTSGTLKLHNNQRSQADESVLDETDTRFTEQPELIGRRRIRNCDQCGINNVQRIIGGDEAIPNEFPWMAQLRADDGFICGGTLIGKNYVLTAAHCFQTHREDLRVVFGAHRLSARRGNGIVERKVVTIRVHPDFDGEKGKAHDIALLKLDKPLTFSRTIRPVCLPSSDQRYIGHNGTVIGWGHTTLDSSLSDRLVRLNLPIIGEEECRRNWYGDTLPHGTLCAGYEDGKKDSCFGDSGSPLMVERNGIWQQVGIVSWGAANSCALTYGVYARVTAYLDWIADNTEDDKCFNRLL